MKKKELEIFLEKIPKPVNPKPNLEQYMTPSVIASDILFIAYQFGDIFEKTVCDLGCGTGIFSIGAEILGAKKVIGIDIDKEVLKIAKDFTNQNNLDIRYLNKDIEKINLNCDTVIMNPPFGAQKSNLKADRRFIEKAFEISKTVYTIHLKNTSHFIEKIVNSLKGKIEFTKGYKFPIKWMFEFHRKNVQYCNVLLYKINTNS